jgi:hypothetical protein
MKGINPFYFYITKSIIAGSIFLLFIIGKMDITYLITSIVLLLIVMLILISHERKEILKIDKGKPIKSTKGKIGSWHYLLVGMVVIFGGFLIIVIYPSCGNIWTMAFILLLGLIISDLNQTHYITIYENGMVFDGIAYYDWSEIDEIKNGDKTILKIKNIPKEIIINENL